MIILYVMDPNQLSGMTQVAYFDRFLLFCWEKKWNNWLSFLWQHMGFIDAAEVRQHRRDLHGTKMHYKKCCTVGWVLCQTDDCHMIAFWQEMHLDTASGTEQAHSPYLVPVRLIYHRFDTISASWYLSHCFPNLRGRNLPMKNFCGFGCFLNTDRFHRPQFNVNSYSLSVC